MDSCRFKMDCELPLVGDVDVLVVGGGPGGLGAAVMAARAGAKTMLVERYSMLGGMASAGEVHPFMCNHYNPEGKPGSDVCMDKPVYSEWTEKIVSYLPPSLRAKAEGDREANRHISRSISKDAAALAAEDLCLEAGVRLLYHHTLVAAPVKGGKIEFVVLHSKSGFVAVKAKSYVDCSGDGDLAARAGCEYEMGGPSGNCQPMTLCFKLSHVDRKRMPQDRKTLSEMYIKAKEEGLIDCPREDVLHFEHYDEDVVHFNTTRVIGKPGTDGVKLSEAEIVARKQLRQYLSWLRAEVPGFEEARLRSMGFHIGVRETRRIKGLAYLTRENFMRRDKFPDAIARCNYPIDIHSATGSGTELVHMPRSEYYEIPYGCIVPKDVGNLTVGGRPISVDHSVHSSMRVMPPACSVGQAAGLAAALSAKKGLPPSKLDGVEVRKELARMGAYL